MVTEASEPVPILLVEDEAGSRQITAMVLTQAGFQTIEAANGAEAFRILDFRTVPPVITDIVMPDMEGMELIRSLRRTPSAPRILAISGGGVNRNGQIEPYCDSRRMCLDQQPERQMEKGCDDDDHNHLGRCIPILYHRDSTT